ncbi:MAG: DinB family protein [Vicinamibacterales bacterium]
MAIKDALLPEWDHEMGTTRRLLERVPPGDFSWKPHDRSMSLGQLAGHLANLPRWCNLILDDTVLDLADIEDDRRSREPTSVEGLLKEFGQKASAARANLAQRLDPELLAPWTLKNEGHVVFTLPRISAIRSFVINHSIHHRGQLTVYLRLRNVPLPPIYGPTADEG